MKSVFVLGALCVVLSGCSVGTEAPAHRAASIEAHQDYLCKSWGFKKGTIDYGRCRQNLYQQTRQEDAQRKQMVAAILMHRQAPNAIYALPPAPSMNCMSSRLGTMINTSCR